MTKRARSRSRDTQTQRTVLPVRTNVIAVIPKIRSCDERVHHAVPWAEDR